MAGFQDRFTSGASHMAGLEAGGGRQGSCQVIDNSIAVVGGRFYQ
jgi:hypothetical protein